MTTDQIAASVASEPVIKAAERLRHECETTEEPNSGFAKDIMTLVEFAEALAAHANECLAPGVSHDHRICEADG